VAETAVREARQSDLEGLLALYGELAESSRAAPAGPGVSRPVLERILADPDRHLLVATIDEQVLATADLLIVANLTHHGEPWAIVENVVVAARAHRRGIGRALMSKLIEVAEEAGCYKVQLLSGRRREAAHALYRAIGMEAVAEGFKLYLDGSPTAEARERG
jgi:ribosomal protein S18 acetylase RimI-like enzyme